MANIFDINWSNVATNLTPYFWRETTSLTENNYMAYLRSMLAPVQVISDDLLLLQNNTINFLQYTGQNMALTEYLNDLYDESLRRIFITENNISSIDPVVLYQTGETTTDIMAMFLTGEAAVVPVSMYKTREVLLDSNFTINIPTSILYDAFIMTNQVRNYVEASKNFNFTTF